MKTTTLFVTSIVGILALTPDSFSNRLSAAEGRFGQALDARVYDVQVPHDPALTDWPVTVSVWVRMVDASGYSVFLASETKAAATHWELFAHQGRLMLYAPGMKPDHVRTQADLGDGRWHFLTASMEPDRVRIAVDGKLVADAPVARPTDLPARDEPLVVGRLVEGRLPAKALIDELIFRKEQTDILAVPSKPAEPDADTPALFPFDGDGQAMAADRASAKRATVFRQYGDPQPVAPPPPPLEDPASACERLPEVIAETAEQLNLTSLRPEDLAPRPALLIHWLNWTDPAMRIFQWNRQLKIPEGRLYDQHALVWPEDHDALGTVLRRTRAALALRLQLAPESIPMGLAEDLVVLETQQAATRDADWAHREGIYYLACILRRRLILSDPLLDFDRLAFLNRGTWAGTRLNSQSNADNTGGHFATQNFGFITKPGGGLWIASDWKTMPQLVEPLRERVFQSGACQGARLNGSVHSLELSYDAQTFLFAHCFSTDNSWTWTPESTWKLFRMNVDGTDLRQLTEGPFNDFDACWLPDGNIVFVSERRGGFIRCFRGLVVPTYVLHRMRPDGSGIHPISLYETSEWNPSVDRDGHLVYARWDYTDREDCLGSTLWTCAPDGCNPRSPHGNYPYPWSTRPEPRTAAYQTGPGRRIMAEMGIRAIPGSDKLVCTVAPHHGEHYGALGVIDLSRFDPDNGMQQLARLTPYQPFPESECRARSNYQYGTPWPLSEDLFLCTSWEDLVVLDRFGNEALILARSEVPRAQDDPAMRLCDPIPLVPRRRPPVIAERSNQWPDAPRPSAGPARISVIDVRNTDLPLPEGVNIRWLRVVQNFLKEDPLMDAPRIGFGDENTPRLSLGLAPVEADGSVSFLAPPNKELIFQLLDEDFRAVHSMRSVAFVHKGEHLACAGCHEPQHGSPRIQNITPLALRRAPSLLEVEPIGREPITFARHIKPILERADLPCLDRPKKVSHGELLPLTFHFAGGFSGNIHRPIHGGSRTIPGYYGARVSVLGREVHAAWRSGTLSDADYRTVTLWLDCHSLRLGAFHAEAAQMAGDLVWPRMDIDPDAPLGLEGHPGENTVERIFRISAQLHPSNPTASGRWRQEDPTHE